MHIEIDRFSGPMALLLHLIREQEMDIFDINIHEITEKYLESVKQMKQLNLEGAGEFIAMAATLIQIKSKMLLPQYNDEGQIVEAEDPRKDLVRRLVEYQMYQEAGQKLYQLPLLNRDVWARAESEKIAIPESEIVLEEENALFALISAYRSAVKNMKKAVHKVTEALQSIRDRIWEMKDHFVIDRPTRFSELVEFGAYSKDRKGQLLITFLSLLELGKMGFVSLFQSDNFADIHIETKKTIDRDVISKVEDYESAQNMALAMGGTTTVATQVEFSLENENWNEPEQTSTEVIVAAPAEATTMQDELALEVATDEDILAEELKMQQEDFENGEETSV